ncbi:MAG: hypothetical protein AB7F86_18070 [Bdellovibrionales bacterium]
MKLIMSICTLLHGLSWASTNDEVCLKKLEKYGLGLARLEPEGTDVEFCGDIVDNCVRPLELVETSPDGTKKFVLTHEFGGSYPNFNVFFISIDRYCQITKIEIMRH